MLFIFSPGLYNLAYVDESRTFLNVFTDAHQKYYGKACSIMQHWGTEPEKKEGIGAAFNTRKKFQKVLQVR